MLDRRNDDVAAARNAALECDALEGQVVALGAAAREDDLLGIAADEGGKMLAGVFDRFVSRAAEGVTARWIAILLGEEREHRLLHGRRDGSRRVVVEINLPHGVPD